MSGAGGGMGAGTGAGAGTGTKGSVRLFVYGSLLPGEYNHSLIRPFVLSAVPGSVAGRLVDVGPYPALLLEPGGIARGLWMEIRKEGLPLLDELEEFHGIEESNDYERVWLADAAHPSLQGWGYVWTDSRGYPYAASAWWPDVASGRPELKVRDE